MANIFTKRSHIPRSTTLGDFGYRSQALNHFSKQRAKDQEPEIIRILSPTRIHNPQPVGLVYQSPYNRNNQVFGIWNPNQMTPVLRCKRTLPHLRRTNFTCQHEPTELQKYMAPADPRAPVQRKPPEICHTIGSIQRLSFRWPPESPEKFQGMVKTTRFGHTPYSAAVGIVPNAFFYLPNTVRRYGSSNEGRCSPQIRRIPRPPSAPKTPSVRASPDKNPAEVQPETRRSGTGKLSGFTPGS